MSELFDKSIRTLELPRVLQLLSEQAVSPEAKELALAVRPETDYEDVLRLLDQTDGARAMIVLRGAPGFSGVKPVKDLLDRADRGGSLNIPELIRIGDLLYAARRRDIQWDHDALVQLDLIFARGELSYKMDAIRPQVRRDGLIRLRKARHPLLDKKTAVPIDIELGGAFDTLVITGPNTGG